MEFVPYNPNPTKKNVGDCTVRAISKATGQSWEQTYAGLAVFGFDMGDMPSANSVWGAYLRAKGYTRRMIPENYPEHYTVRDFANDNPIGTYILALSGHVVCVIDGALYDSWDSSGEIPIYFWSREE